MSVFLSVMRIGDPNPDFPDLPEMADPKPIGLDEIRRAIASVPHYRLVESEDGVQVKVPCGEVGSIWLDYSNGSGVLSFQLHSTHGDHTEAILNALRRFAGCIPDAAVDSEGEIFKPLPWDVRRPSGAN